jgi:hypothetical protein
MYWAINICIRNCLEHRKGYHRPLFWKLYLCQSCGVKVHATFNQVSQFRKLSQLPVKKTTFVWTYSGIDPYLSFGRGRSLNAKIRLGSSKGLSIVPSDHGWLVYQRLAVFRYKTSGSCNLFLLLCEKRFNVLTPMIKSNLVLHTLCCSRKLPARQNWDWSTFAPFTDLLAIYNILEGLIQGCLSNGSQT